MDPATASIIGAGVSAGGGIIGQLATNKQNRELTHEAWARDDTAHQRETEDLKAAGINPLLAAGGSGAGNSAPIAMQNPAGRLPDFGGAFISGKQVETQKKAQEVQSVLANDQININKINKDILDIQLQRIKHDYEIDKKRKLRSSDQMGEIDRWENNIIKLLEMYDKYKSNGAKSIGNGIINDIVERKQAQAYLDTRVEDMGKPKHKPIVRFGPEPKPETNLHWINKP